MVENPRTEINHVFIWSLNHIAVAVAYYINDCLSCCLVEAAIWRDLWHSDCVSDFFFHLPLASLHSALGRFNRKQV